MKDNYIEIDGFPCCIKVSEIRAFMIVPDDPQKVKIEYSAASSTVVRYGSPEDARNIYEKLRELLVI